MIRPSYVLGGRAMEIIRDEEAARTLHHDAPCEVSGASPVLIDQYLSRATEVDVDALCDGESVFVAGVMEHIEEAGVHSGDSACSLPPYSLTDETVAELKRQTEAMAFALNVRGLMNVQFAIEEPLSAHPRIFVLEVNPRASRTVPFVAKTIGRPIAAIAAKFMAGERLTDFGLSERPFDHIAVKEAVFPFARFPGVDTVLGPEMRSTGEVMGLDWRRPGEDPAPPSPAPSPRASSAAAWCCRARAAPSSRSRRPTSRSSSSRRAGCSKPASASSPPAAPAPTCASRGWRSS